MRCAQVLWVAVFAIIGFGAAIGAGCGTSVTDEGPLPGVLDNPGPLPDGPGTAAGEEADRNPHPTPIASAGLSAQLWRIEGRSASGSVEAAAVAIGPRRLVTTARAARELVGLFEQARASASVVQVDTGIRRPLVSVWVHPEFDPDAASATPDVALLATGYDLPGYLEPASKVDALDVRPQDGVGVIALGGAVAGPQFTPAGVRTTAENIPEPVWLSGKIEEVRPFDANGPRGPQENRYLRLAVGPGGAGSGSAVIDYKGDLIGIVVDGAGETQAVRIDALLDLIRLVETTPLSVGTALTAAPVGMTCPRICSGEVCDSDCDGWFDDVEIASGDDPCDASVPGFAPPVQVPVCGGN